MLNQINVITRLTVMQRGNKAVNGSGHYKGTTKSFSLMTNRNYIEETVPTNPDRDQVMILRRVTTHGDTREYEWRPFYVREAANWLEDNNYLYEAKVSIPATPDYNRCEHDRERRIRVETITMDDDEDNVEADDIRAAAVGGEQNEEKNEKNDDDSEQDEDGDPVDISGGGGAEHILLNTVEHTSDLHKLLVELSRTKATQGATPYIAEAQQGHCTREKASIFKTMNFLQLSNVDLYPYDRGTGKVSGKQSNGSGVGRNGASKVSSSSSSRDEDDDDGGEDSNSDSDDGGNEEGGGGADSAAEEKLNKRVNVAPGWGTAYVKQVLQYGKIVGNKKNITHHHLLTHHTTHRAQVVRGCSSNLFGSFSLPTLAS